MPLIITSPEYYDKVVAEVKAHPDGERLMPKLEAQLDYLRNFSCSKPGADDGRFDIELGWDFAKWSFSIRWFSKETHNLAFNGGLIFHPGAMGPDSSLSVELCPSDEPHWSVHT